MKILMLNYEFPPIGGGGGNAHRHLLTQYAKQDNLHIDVLTSSPQPGHSTESFSENITIYKMGIHKKNLHYWRKTEVLEWLFKANRKLKTMLAENQYDLAHAFFGFPTGWLTYRHRHKLPYIISLRGSDVPGFNVRLKLDYHLLKGLFHKIWQNADAVIANSKGLAELAAKFEPSLDIGVICNGIDTKTFTPPLNRILVDCIKLLTVCRLIARKRIHLLIEAVHHLKQQGIDAELNIVGEGNLLNELQTQAGRLKINDRVNFLGLVGTEEMPSVYQQNHLFLMSSAHEGMSNAMLEAMASGLPILSTACEGTQELITDNGIIVSEPTSENIAEAIMHAAEDRQQYARMSVASRTIAEKFSWSNTANQYLQLYATFKSFCR
ncbi:MAG: glycosyltransferase family 4 protein [Planctomycetota bacterium]|jgi:glycosyltransferase involved in cell wall biosynthesis